MSLSRIVPVADTPPTLKSYNSLSSLIESSTVGVVILKLETFAGTVINPVVASYVTPSLNVGAV